MRLSKRGKRRMTVVALALLLLVAAGGGFRFVRQAQQHRMTAEARQTGLEAYRLGDLDLALTKLKYYLDQHGRDLDVDLIYAEACSRKPQPGARHLFDAVDHYATHVLPVLDEQPQTADVTNQRREVLIRLLHLYAQIGDRERVEMAADALLKIEPAMIDALAARGEVQFLGRRFDEALATAQKLIELDPHTLTWRRMLLEIRARQGASDDELVRQCREWAAEYQGDARFRLLAAATLLDAHRRDEARTELQSVAALGADEPDVLEQLVGLLDVLDLRSEGDAVVDATRQRFPREAWVYEIAVRRLWHDGRIDEALAAVEQALQSVMEPSPQLLRLHVLSLMAAGREPEAASALRPLLTMSAADRQRDADRAWAAAVAATLGGDKESPWRETVEALQAALTFAPKDPVLHFLMADASLRAGEFAAAIASFQHAVTLAPNWIAAGLAHGEALRSAGRIADAFQVSQTVLSRAASDRPGPFLLFARCLIDLREAGITPSISGVADVTADTLATLRQLHEQTPPAEEPAIIALLARGYLASGDQAAMADLARQAMASSDVSVEALLALAEISRRGAADTNLQRELVARARAIAGLTIHIAMTEARLLAEGGQADEGLRLIDQAIAESQPEDPLRRQALLARTAYLVEIEQSPAALAAMLSLASEYAGSLEVQQFILAQPAAWGDSRLIARSMANLKRLLGDTSTQVRLAEANFLIRNHAHEPAMLARAITTLNGVLEEAPDSLAALSLAAEALTLGDHPSLDRASVHLERAALLYPGEPSLLVRLIALLQRQGRFDTARRHLQTLAEALAHHPQFAFDELRLLHAQGDFETALVRAAALVNDQSPPPQQLLLAAMEERTGAIDRAEAIYTRLLEASPPDPSIVAQAAEFYAATGRFARGLALIEQVPALPGGASRETHVGGFHQRHGRAEEAGRWLRLAVERDPQSIQARDELARHYLAQGDRARARDEALHGLRIDREHRGLRVTLAIANLGLPNADRAEAIKLLREFGSGNDALLAMLELLEQVPMRDGRSVPTASHLAQARQLTDQHAMFVPVWRLAVSLHVEAGRRPEAIAIARSAVSRLPGQVDPSEWATQLLMDAARWDEALVEAEEWRRRSLSDPLAADCALARVLIALRRPAEALDRVRGHTDRIIEEREAFPMRLATLVEALVRGEETERARQIISPLLAEHRRWREMWTATAALMPSAEAEAALNEIESQAKEPEDWLALAMQWLALAQRTNQVEHLERAMALATRAADQPATAVGAAITLGAVAEARSDWTLAEQHYRAALAKAPDNAIALNNLAYVLALQPSRAGEALPLIEKALEIQEDQPDFLDTYGMVLLAAKRPADAEEAFQRALGLRPDEPSFMLSLAAAHLEQNQHDHAAVLLDQVERRSTLSPAQRQRLSDLKERLTTAENPPSASAGPTSSPN